MNNKTHANTSFYGIEGGEEGGEEEVWELVLNSVG